MTSATARDQRVGVPRLEAGEDSEQGHVRDDSRKDLRVLDLPGHHGLRHAVVLENLDTLAEVAERDRVVARVRITGRLLQFRKRFFLDGDDGDVVAEAARPLEREKRKPAVAGDDAYAGQVGYRAASKGRRTCPPKRQRLRVYQTVRSEGMRRTLRGILVAGGDVRSRRLRQRGRERDAADGAADSDALPIRSPETSTSTAPRRTPSR